MAGRAPALGALLLLALAAPILLDQPQALAEGQLAVTSVPSGATVLLEGQYAGETPVLLDAPAGSYRIQVRLKGRHPQRFTARVADGLTTRRTVRLVAEGPRTGELRIVSDPPGAALYLDGVAIGTSPRVLRGLPPGRYRVGAVRDGYRTTARTAVVHGGLTSSVALSLPVLPAPAPAPAQAAPRRPVAEAPAPVHRSGAVRHRAHARTTPQRHVTPPAAPVDTAPVPLPAAPAADLDHRMWLFWPLMLLVLAGLVRHLVRAERKRRAAMPAWYPALPGRWILPWTGDGAPDDASMGAVAAMSIGRWQEGAEVLWSVLGCMTGTAWHYYHLGLAYQHLGRMWEAESAYRTAIQMDPAWDAPHFNLACLLEATHQPAEAVIAYRRLLLACPNHAAGHFNLGHVYVELAMWNQAIAQWKTARKLAPRDPAAKQNLRAIRDRARQSRSWRISWKAA